MSTIDKLSSRRSADQLGPFGARGDWGLTLNGGEQWRYMVGDSSEGMVQGIADTPWKHDIENLVH